MAASSSDGSDDSVWWTLIKYGIFIIGALVVLGWVFNIVAALFPLLAVIAVAFVLYKMFIDSDDPEPTTASEPKRLEYQSDEDIILDNDVDPLEEKFKELERGADQP